MFVENNLLCNKYVRRNTNKPLDKFSISELFDIQDTASVSISSKCDREEVTSFIKKYVGTAYLKSESNREIHYILPYDEAKKGNFDKLFTNLDDNLNRLHVSSYGVMDMTLEEVFLKVTEIAEEEEGTVIWFFVNFHIDLWSQKVILSISVNWLMHIE